MVRSATLDPGLSSAAHRLVTRALGVHAGERVVVVHDAAHDEIARAIAEAVTVAKSEPIVFRLEDLSSRPHSRLDPAVAGAIADAQASVLAIDFHAGELQMRTELIELAHVHELRHGHMVGIGRASMIAGFSVDPMRIAEKSRALAVRLTPTSTITVRSGAGTDLTIGIAPWCRWTEYGAVVSTGKRVNLPGGELVTSPDAVNGVYVADGTLGDADGHLRRKLQNTPVTLRLTASRVQALECKRDLGLARELESRLARVANLDRVGLVGFGVNLGLTEPTGDVFADQKVPGVHLSLGESFPARTGATWTAKSWVALTLATCDVEIDRVVIVRSGRYLV